MVVDKTGNLIPLSDAVWVSRVPRQTEVCKGVHHETFKPFSKVISLGDFVSIRA